MSHSPVAFNVVLLSVNVVLLSASSAFPAAFTRSHVAASQGPHSSPGTLLRSSAARAANAGIPPPKPNGAAGSCLHCAPTFHFKMSPFSMLLGYFAFRGKGQVKISRPTIGCEFPSPSPLPQAPARVSRSRFRGVRMVTSNWHAPRFRSAHRGQDLLLLPSAISFLGRLFMKWIPRGLLILGPTHYWSLRLRTVSAKR